MEIPSTSRVSGENTPSLSVSPVPPAQRAEHRELIQAVKAVNHADLLGYDSELAIFVDRETRKPVVRVVDRETKEVIRQMPPEYVIKMAQFAEEIKSSAR